MAGGLVLFILPAILGAIVVTPPCFASDYNLLFSGKSLLTDQRLSYDKYTFVMQGDCNLVLYNGGWQSNTANNGKHCILSLDNFGQLTIKSGTDSIVWRSSAKSKDGNYVAALHPEGKVVVYGPAVWSTHRLSASPAGDVPAGSRNIPLVDNLFFSGQVLYSDGKLSTGGYTFIMQGDCNLVLYGGNWQSNTHGRGKNCYLTLDYTGLLSIKDDSHNAVWSSVKKSVEGDYVLVLQGDGNVVIYGPAIWSTKSSSAVKIAMVTEE